jgi:glycosyltransferase involved in cell wall biosynthesis
MRIALLSAGKDRPYALGVAGSLLQKGVQVDFVGNDDLQNETVFLHANARYFNLRGDQRADATLRSKVYRVLRYYFKLIKFAGSTDTELFHILWLNKFAFFDSTLLNMFYKLMNKKLLYTAHNINAKARDGGDNLVNRTGLTFLYWIVDHIFVHTQAMKDELARDFGVHPQKVTVIPFGINDTVPVTELTSREARDLLSLSKDDIVLLFFGYIAPYKGLEILIDALSRIAPGVRNVKLIIAGAVKNSETYWHGIESRITRYDLHERIIRRINYIPDEEIEVFFKAADAVILPYKFIYQSGPLLLAYSFGLPVIANNVGSFREDIVEGVTGFVSAGNDAEGLADAILKFVDSSLYKERERTRDFIQSHAMRKYSWESIAQSIVNVYETLSSSPHSEARTA